MAVQTSTFTSAYAGVAHGALNWDTQLKADMQAIQALTQGAVNMGTTFDWNDLSIPGQYYLGGGNPHSPLSDGSFWYALVLSSGVGNANVIQVAFRISAVDTNLYFRQGISGWQAWRKIASALA